MKIKDLLEELKACNPESTVLVAHKLLDSMCEIEEIGDYSDHGFQEEDDPFVLLYIGKDTL